MNILEANILATMKRKTKKLTVLQRSFNHPLNSCL